MPEGAPDLNELRRRSVQRRVIGMLVAAGLLLVIAIAAAVAGGDRVVVDTKWVERSLEVRTAIYRVGSYNERVETARRGYFISGDPRFADAIRRSEAQMRGSLRELKILLRDKPRYRAQIAQLGSLRDRKWRLVDDLLRDRDGVVQATDTATLYDAEIVTTMRRMRRILEAMDAQEVRLLAERKDVQDNSLQLFRAVGWICILALVMLVIAAMVLIARYNRDLTVAQARLRTANEGLEEAVAARTGELSRANAEIQRFAYIVSHDLRSPLVNVLGFTAELDTARKTLHAYLSKLFAERPELRDEAAWLAVEEDFPEALDFIRVSTEKMDRLINSILALSRQGRRTLTPEPLDLTAIAEDITATLHQRAEDAGATVTIAPLPPITSDRIAVEQILSNLMENALKYLSPARPGEVRVEGRQTGRWVQIDVIDNGRGIAPADHERIFDLFRRAGAQDQAGEGIGLANVRALAYRLGGRVEVQSQLGEGARFTVTLPQEFAGTEITP